MSEDSVNTVKQQLLSFLELIDPVKESQSEFYRCIRSCVTLFWQRKTYDFGPNGSQETWSRQKPMSHHEAIQKIKEQVIPLLKTAKSHVAQNSKYVQRFQELCNYIEAFFPEKQSGGGGLTETRQNRMRELLDELISLLDESDV
jgi:hypothetical protein